MLNKYYHERYANDEEKVLKPKTVGRGGFQPVQSFQGAPMLGQRSKPVRVGKGGYNDRKKTTGFTGPSWAKNPVSDSGSKMQTTAVNRPKTTASSNNVNYGDSGKYGNNGVGTKQDYKNTRDRLSNDEDYFNSEMQRAQAVMQNRADAGMDTSAQEKYLETLSKTYAPMYQSEPATQQPATQPPAQQQPSQQQPATQQPAQTTSPEWLDQFYQQQQSNWAQQQQAWQQQQDMYGDQMAQMQSALQDMQNKYAEMMENMGYYQMLQNYQNQYGLRNQRGQQYSPFM